MSCKTRKATCSTSCEPVGRSQGTALILAFLGFGLDRFYVGQVGFGVALLLGYITVIGMIVAVPVEVISQISLVISILAGSSRPFMYDCVFAPPCMFDKVIAVLWIAVILLITILCAVLVPRHHA